MCEFCARHGEGKVWYLQAANHSRELMERLKTEERLRRHAGHFERSTVRLFTLYDRLSPLWRRFSPLKRLAHAWAHQRQKKRHFGQVLPTEHARQVLSRARSVVRLPCSCRRFVRGQADARYCFGLGFDPAGVFDGFPDYRGRLEVLGAGEAAALIERFQEEENLVHTVWTMPTPFVASICNCSLGDCGAMLTNYRVGIGVIFPGEYTARVDIERCRGCRACLAACQFGALFVDLATGKVAADPVRCQGCGACRRPCPFGAIVLERPGEPALPLERLSADPTATATSHEDHP